jgi:ethanolamine utilization protein EutN
MRIGEVIGVVTLNRAHPSLQGAALRLTVPLTLDDLRNDWRPRGEELVVYDDLGAGVGSRIAFSEGGEAAQPFLPEDKPIDAYNAAILDDVHLPLANDDKHTADHND